VRSSQNNNTHPLTVARTVATFHKTTCEVLDHPAYIPDMTPDSHLLGPIKKAFRSRRFVDDDDVTETVHDGLRTQKSSKFLERRANSVQNRVEYVKKKLLGYFRKIKIDICVKSADTF
jgi:hypothetical protein